jgi:endonuclease/exonuclease/phosphatase family metal-dependent hydrolase
MIKYFLLLSLSSIFLFSIDLKIASYNVENLFDMQNNGTEYDEYKPNKHNWTNKNLKKKLLNIAEVICDINADIIGLQEVENENVLKLLRKNLKQVGCYYQYYTITHKKKSAIQVALLSKIPIDYSQEIVVSQSLEYRNILEVKFKVENQTFFIFVNHWTSKRSDESKRIYSARTLVHRLKNLPDKSEYIILGDFNNDYDEHLKEEKTAINHILKTIDTNGKFFRMNDLFYQDFSHYNLWLEQPNFRRWSHNFYGNKQALDTIVLPQTLFDGKGIDYVDNSFEVFKRRYLFQKYGYLFRWQYKKNRHLGKGYSDHLPIYAIFSTSKMHRNKIKSFKNGLIDDLFLNPPYYPLLLKSVQVISLQKNKAIIRQEGAQNEIALYGVEKSLKLYQRYDIMVYKRKKYKGHYEVIDFEIEKSYDTFN